MNKKTGKKEYCCNKATKTEKKKVKSIGITGRDKGFYGHPDVSAFTAGSMPIGY